VFDLYDIERLTAWKEFRNTLEVSTTPLEDVAILWSKAPFVSNRLSLNPKSWPDPWQLIINGEFDSLGLVLGMLHTLQLTDRFKGSRFEIHMYQQEKDREFILVINNVALNWSPREVVDFSDLSERVDFTKVWSTP
jgi:hypothetical protein